MFRHCGCWENEFRWLRLSKIPPLIQDLCETHRGVVFHVKHWHSKVTVFAKLRQGLQPDEHVLIKVSSTFAGQQP